MSCSCCAGTSCWTSLFLIPVTQRSGISWKCRRKGFPCQISRSGKKISHCLCSVKRKFERDETKPDESQTITSSRSEGHQYSTLEHWLVRFRSSLGVAVPQRGRAEQIFVQNWGFQKSHPWHSESEHWFLSSPGPWEKHKAIKYSGLEGMHKEHQSPGLWTAPRTPQLPLWDGKPFFCPRARPARHWCHYYQFFPKILAQLSVLPVPLDFRSWVSIVTKPQNHNLTQIAAF